MAARRAIIRPERSFRQSSLSVLATAYTHLKAYEARRDRLLSLTDQAARS
jgi:hypothetical protein